MNPSSFIAKRYFKTQGNQPFSRFLTFVACTGVGLGVAALIIVLSVMNGFTLDLENKLLGFNSHITIHTNTADQKEINSFINEIDNLDGIRTVTKTMEGEAIAQSAFWGDTSAIGIKVRGIEPSFFGTMKAQFFIGESYDQGMLHSKKNKVILGHELAGELGVHPDLMENVKLSYPFGEITPTGDFIPSSKEVGLIGVFKSGFFEYDSKYALINLPEAKSLFGPMAEFTIHIWTKNQNNLLNVKEAIQYVMNPTWKIHTWDETNKKLFSALRLERIGMFVVLSLIIIIAAFSIVGIILMRVFRKRKDIAILQTVGFNPRMIRTIFLTEGAFIGLTGSIAGLMVGLIIILALKRWPITLPDSYYLSYLPVNINPVFIGIIVLIGIAAAIIATLYPASRAAKINLVRLLRYE
ncbi:FtsX-like permease family protein [bacterium]|nr:FtsX-like permease family protein [bacterium]